MKPLTLKLFGCLQYTRYSNFHSPIFATTGLLGSKRLDCLPAPGAQNLHRVGEHTTLNCQKPLKSCLKNHISMAFCPERLLFIWNFLNYFDFCDCLFCQNKREIWKEIVSYNFYWWNQESFAGTAKNSSGQKHYKSPNCLLLLIPLINYVNNIVSSSKCTKAFYRWKPWRNYWKYQDTWLVFDPCWHCPLCTNNLWGPMPMKPSKHC